jgi:hypothetical protein
MNKKYFVFLFLLLFLSIAGVVYFFNTHNTRQANLWQMLPNTPAVVLQADQLSPLLEKWDRPQSISRAFMHSEGFKHVYQQLQFLDSLFQPKEKWRTSFKKSQLYLAFYPGENPFLLLLENPEIPRTEALKDYLKNALGKGYVVIYGHTGNFPVAVIKIFNTTTNQSFWLWKMDGALLFTANENLMETSISGYQMREDHFSDSPGFQSVQRTSGKRVDAHLFVYYPVLGKWLNTFLQQNFQYISHHINHFAGWGETDIILHPDEVIFSGYTSAGNHNVLSRFQGQKPVTLSAFTLFPFNSTFAYSEGFSNFSEYAGKKISAPFKTAYQTDIEILAKATGNDVSLVSNAVSSHEISQKTWVIIQLRDIPKAARVLKNLSLKSDSRQVFRTENHLIRKINIRNLLKNMYGDPYSVITQNYYCILNGYAVFANSRESLDNLIRYSETGKTLDLDENYKSFSNNLAGTSNLLIQIMPRASLDLMDYFLNKKTVATLDKFTSFLNNIQGIAFQFSNDRHLVYTNFYIRYNPSFREENMALWKTRLNDAIVGKPFLVKDHKTKKYDLIVFDRGNRMYLIDHTGKILWTRRLPELPMSSIYQVDYYKNGKIQYLFNTRDHLFIIDRKGRFVPGFPIAIHPEATNGLSLFDYTQRKDYRILLAQADKRIYNYKINGDQVSGWNKPRMQAITSQKVTRLLTHHKDFIIINDDANHVKIVNRRGQIRIYLKASVNKARHSGYFVNKTNNKGLILTTNTSGKLVYITASGTLRYTDFGKFSPGHYFLYDDFNGDGSLDFIFVDKNQLKVFDRYKKLLFSYQFHENITIQPKFFSLGNRQRVLGIVASKEKTIYLFDNKGNIVINRGLTGETPFTVGSLNNNREVNIVTAIGSTLYNYRIK